MSTKYDIRLEGVHALDLSLGVLRDLANLLVEGAQRSARLAAEGRSSARGTPPPWLAGSADVRLVGFREGSVALDLTAQPLAHVAPDIFAQQNLFATWDGNTTAMDLFMDAVDDALHGSRDSERLDGGILTLLASTRNLFDRGPTRLKLARQGAAPRVIEFEATAVRNFQTLADLTPAPRVERVVGVLDTLTYSTRTLVLKLEDGTDLRGGLGTALSLDTARSLLGHKAVVEGSMTFKASGRPLRIEADYMALASERDEVWARMPRGETGTAPHLLAPGGDLTSFFGQWPGDETDEEAFAALDELS